MKKLYRFELQSDHKSFPLIVEVKGRNLFEAECELGNILNDVGKREIEEGYKRITEKLKSLNGKPLSIVSRSITSDYKLISVHLC